MSKIRIGTRGSKLALKQASFVRKALLQANDVTEAEILVVHTKGDKIQDKPLTEIGDKGVFASELEQALLNGQIDIAVHSAKDLPVATAEGLEIAAVLPRGDVRDVLVICEGGRVPLAAGDAKLFDGCVRAADAQDASDRRFVIGSGSRRRQQQVSRFWENAVCKNIRGNVDTRLLKLKEGGSDGTIYDGIILAKAGLDRLEIACESRGGFVFYPLSPERFLPAACQGIIAVEALRDSFAYTLCRKITDAETELNFLVEREVLAQLAADCSEAVAAWCRQNQDGLVLDVMYAENRQRLTCAAGAKEGLKMAQKAAELVKSMGAAADEAGG